MKHKIKNIKNYGIKRIVGVAGLVVCLVAVCIGMSVYHYAYEAQILEMREAYSALRIPSTEHYNEEEKRWLNSLLELRDESFDNFEIDELRNVQSYLDSLEADVQRRLAGDTSKEMDQ